LGKRNNSQVRIAFVCNFNICRKIKSGSYSFFIFIKTKALKSWTYRLLQPFIVLHVIIITGIVGFMVIEKYSFVEALYMTTISVTTAGFQEVRPLSEAGRLFTMFLLITSWISFAFVITRITEFVISGEINKYFKTRRMFNAINQLSGHVIVCGYGRNGHQACHTLTMHNVPFVVIEKNIHHFEHELQHNNGLLFLTGDGTDDELLKRAGIDRAKALITTLPLDADNVFIVLSARSLNQSIQIISRASDAASIPKMKKAGADNVIMPDRIGGAHMATLVSKPDVIEFIDYLSGEEGESINMESVSYDDLPEAIKDKTLQDIMAWKKTGVNCIGIKNSEGKFVINPPEGTIISKGMKVIVLGTKQQIQWMKGNLA
jgi:voltage-gated potassium channel